MQLYIEQNIVCGGLQQAVYGKTHMCIEHRLERLACNYKTNQILHAKLGPITYIDSPHYGGVISSICAY